MDMTRISEIKSALKRARVFAKDIPYEYGFGAHPLAAPIDNYNRCIDAEIEDELTDYVFILEWYYAQARQVNAFFDAHMVKDDKAAHYWLHQFLKHEDAVIDWDKV